MRLFWRIVALVCGLVAVGVALSATEAGAAESCDPAALGAVSFSLDGGAPADDLADLEPLAAGDVVTMQWDGSANGCADLEVVLASHRLDASPTAELTRYESCVVGDCGGSLTVEVPDRTVVCRGELVAVTGPPQLDRSLYRTQELGAAVIDQGDCAPAAPSGFAAVLCARNGIDVAVRNTGEVDTAVVVRVNGLDTRSFEVPGGDERSTLLDFFEDLPITIEVIADRAVILERTFRPDCFPEPAVPTIAPDCAAGGAAVTLDNPTPRPMTYVVVVDGAKTDVVVGAHRIERYDVAIGEDTERLIAVMSDETTELARATVRRDCERPRASVALDCDSSSAVFTLANEGPSVAMVDLVLDGTVIVTIPVPGGEQRLVVRLDVVEDRPALLSATSSGVELTADRLTLDCEPVSPPGTPPPTSAPVAPITPTASSSAPAPQVLGVSVRRPSTGAPVSTAAGTLPKTGSDPVILVVVGGLLLTIGGFFLALSGARETSGFGVVPERR